MKLSTAVFGVAVAMTTLSAQAEQVETLTGLPYMEEHAVDGVVPKNIAVCKIFEGGVQILDGDQMYATSANGAFPVQEQKTRFCSWTNPETGKYIEFYAEAGDIKTLIKISLDEMRLNEMSLKM